MKRSHNQNEFLDVSGAEHQLLLRCCAVTGSFADGRPAISSLVERGVDWNRFLALANRNGVAPMVAARLGAEGAANLTPHVARALRLSYEVNALRCNHLAGCAVEIVDSFAAAGVPAIAIKGPALAIAAYGDVAMRVFGDLDFVVRLEDLPRAATALERVGYSSSPAYRADAIESGFFPDVALDFMRPDSVVDLQWQLSPSYFPFAPAGDQVWNRTADIDLLGRRVRVLGHADSILFQACHGSKHGWMTLAQICDFARVLASAPTVRLLRPARRRAARGQPEDAAARGGVGALAEALRGARRTARRRPSRFARRAARPPGNAGYFRFEACG